MHSWSEFLQLVHGSQKMTSQTMIGHTNYNISFSSPPACTPSRCITVHVLCRSTLCTCRL